ncbi:MAG: NAD-dependent epimerase/dehydratase family protein [Leptospirillia bacterium]
MSEPTSQVHAIIGGTGFVGRYLADALRTTGQARVRLLARNHPDSLPPETEFYPADAVSGNGLKEGLSRANIIWYLPGILAETRDQSYEMVHHQGIVNTLSALDQQSLRRIVHISAVGTAPNAPSAYHRTKARGEDALRKSHHPYTIVRPSLVFGKGDRSINQFLAIARLVHVLPMIGPGTARVQPIFAGDLARLCVMIAEREETLGKIYEAGGPRIYTYRQMMEAIKTSRHLKAPILGAPVPIMMASAMLQKLLLPRPFLTPDVLRMALSDNVPEKNACIADFAMTLLALEAWLEGNASS